MSKSKILPRDDKCPWLKRREKGKPIINPKTGEILKRPQGPGKMSITHCLKKLMTQDIDLPKHLAPLIGDTSGERPGKARIEVVIACQLAYRAITTGDLKAIKEVLDRTEGRAIQRTEVTGKDGAPLDFAAGAADIIRSRLLQAATLGEAEADS